jgi:dihydroorotate dehydrogenase (NAD+) catalytic subunit
LPTSLLPKINFTINDDKLKIRGYWLASGVLGVAASTMIRVMHSGADAVVTKSIGSSPRKGHAGPVLTASHGGLLNAVGLTNPGIDAFEDEMKLLNKANIPVIMSIFGNTPEEIAQIVEKAVKMKPSAIELNLSCPHAEISQISHSPDLTYKYVKSAKEVADVPVFAKLTPNASDYILVGKAAQKAGADAIVAINTVRGMRIDIHQQRPILGNTVGGLSGPSIFPIAVRCVFDLYSALSIPIIGVGGVSSWEDAIEMHLAGASAIQIGTAVMNDMKVFSRVKSGVHNYLKEMGLNSVDNIIGAGVKSET